ncbi:hypothetical protein B0H14DRAFT_1459997 [Mycena olivaceomarginata]|nr:hypothetical protein B0H14DRAFT_1459997 [Mycena olivaceomarginata]
MAITTATSASASSAAAPTAVKGEPASPTASSSSNDTTPKTNDAAASTPTLTGNTAPAGTPPKRRAARRANTAERRATHNAVERMRRETLNGRFLTLASLLPPLAALRRPSKAAIVSSSIATVNAAARHRVLAAQTLRSLAREAEQLRREVNEWRARARVPQLDVPVRSDAHNAVLRAELEDFELELDADVSLEEDGDEGDEPNDNHDNNTEEASPVSPAVATPSPAAASPQQLHDTAASIKRARSGSASAPAHSFYTPSLIHTAMPMPMPPPTDSPTLAPALRIQSSLSQLEKGRPIRRFFRYRYMPIYQIQSEKCSRCEREWENEESGCTSNVGPDRHFSCVHAVPFPELAALAGDPNCTGTSAK